MMKYLTVIFLVFILMTAAVADEYTEGTDSANSILKELGSPAAANERLSKPLTSSNTPMTSLGGTAKAPASSFTAQLTSKSSKAFLTATATPGAFGGLSQLTIQEDIAMTGTASYTYTVPVSIEGVCANGIIHCDSGTWNNCSYYIWKDSNGITLNPTTINTLEACYCINSSCGYTLNMDHVLKDLGGGMVSAIQSDNPSTTITNVGVTGSTISYYGMLSSTTASNITSNTANSSLYVPGMSDPSTLYKGGKSDTDLVAAGKAEAAKESTDPNSPEYALSATSGKNGYAVNPITAQACQINAGIGFKGNTPFETVNNTCNIDTNICSLSEEYICDYNGGNCVQTLKYGSPTGQVAIPIPHTLIAPDNTAWTFTFNGSQITYTNSSTNGTVPAIGSEVWWTIKQEYTCQSNKPVIDSYTTNALSMTQNLTPSVNLSGTTMTFKNPDGSTNTSTIYPGTKLPTGAPCAKSCTVSGSSQDTQIGATTTDAAEQNNINTTGITYLACVNGACPVGTGQTIVKDCQCINDFVTAASSMQSMDNASHDMICTQP
jgi:hypothetical protein